MRTTPIFVPNGIKIQQRKKKWAAIEKNARRRLTIFLFYDMRRLIFSLEEANTRNFVEVEGEEANIFVGGG